MHFVNLQAIRFISFEIFPKEFGSAIMEAFALRKSSLKRSNQSLLIKNELKSMEIGIVGAPYCSPAFKI